MIKSNISGQQISAQDKRLTNKSILVLEDDYFIAFDLRSALIDCGAKVIGPISDPDYAQDIIEIGQIVDAAIVDINLNGEMSFSVVDELIKRDVPVLFMTGYDSSVVPYRLRHITRYQKPVPSQKIVQGVIKLISHLS